MPLGVSAEEALNIEFWKGLEPSLCIESGAPAPEFQTPELEPQLARLRVEGYVNLPGVLPSELVQRLYAGVERLYQRGIPLPFTFVYDEFWHAFQGLQVFLEAVLGASYRALPDFWVWYVPASNNAAGWGPHRDKVGLCLDRDNSPHSLTVWLPFSDATPLNGCIYMLPAHLDERFKRRVWDGEGNNAVGSLFRGAAVLAGVLRAAEDKGVVCSDRAVRAFCQFAPRMSIAPTVRSGFPKSD